MMPGWERKPTPVDGVDLIIGGTEVHAILKRSGVVTRRNVRAVLVPLMDDLGFVTTRVSHHDARSTRFVRSIGFKKTWADDRFTYYMLTNTPFTRKEN